MICVQLMIKLQEFFAKLQCLVVYLLESKIDDKKFRLNASKSFVVFLKMAVVVVVVVGVGEVDFVVGEEATFLIAGNFFSKFNCQIDRT